MDPMKVFAENKKAQDFLRIQALFIPETTKLSNQTVQDFISFAK